ncbi:MAG: hypothetical protein KGM44_13530 [bacterium]|nr:hypothetical protein [bacterium]
MPKIVTAQRVPGSRIPVYRVRAIDDLFARVYRRRGERAIRTIQHAFVTNKTATGRLFGVSRQALDLWLRDGVPPARVAEVDRVAEIARELRKRFVAERLPSIVRAALPGLGGQSILDTIATRGVRPVYDLLERLASYVPAA